MNDVLIQPTSTMLDRGGREFPVLEIVLGGTPRGIILLVCDMGDLSVSAGEIMNRFAEHGYESLAAEATSAHSLPTLDALFARAAARGWTAEQTGMVGLGTGGLTVLDAAVRRSFAAAVSFSPTDPNDADTAPGVAVERFSAGVATPWLGLFGADDPGAPAHWIANLESALDRNCEIHTATVRYPGCGRELYRHGNDGPGYAAWYDGWQRTVEWLGARVAPRPTPLATQWRARRSYPS